MIDNRPSILDSIPFYNSIPNLPIQVDTSILPNILKFDMDNLFGILPLTTETLELYPNRDVSVASPQVIEYYFKKEINLQLIFIVVNLYSFRMDKGILKGYPYSISLLPASKRDKPDIVSILSLKGFDFEEFFRNKFIYSHFNPFKGAYGFWGDISLLMQEDGMKVYTDSIGFVLGAYYLATKIDKQKILLPNIYKEDSEIMNKYYNYRIKRYFKLFENLIPRKLWGVDSPIELFLIHGLAAKKLFPVIQTLVFENGSIYPNYYQMYSEIKEWKKSRIVTEMDLFFENEKLAVFCDSKKYHRSKKSNKSAEKIDEFLNDLGIDVLRFSGQKIINDLSSCVDEIEEYLLKK